MNKLPHTDKDPPAPPTQRESQRQQLRNQLLAGAVSCATAPVTPAYFRGLRQRILATRFRPRKIEAAQ